MHAKLKDLHKKQRLPPKQKPRRRRAEQRLRTLHTTVRWRGRRQGALSRKPPFTAPRPVRDERYGTREAIELNLNSRKLPFTAPRRAHCRSLHGAAPTIAPGCTRGPGGLASRRGGSSLGLNYTPRSATSRPSSLLLLLLLLLPPPPAPSGRNQPTSVRSRGRLCIRWRRPPAAAGAAGTHRRAKAAASGA